MTSPEPHTLDISSLLSDVEDEIAIESVLTCADDQYPTSPVVGTSTIHISVDITSASSVDFISAFEDNDAAIMAAINGALSSYYPEGVKFTPKAGQLMHNSFMFTTAPAEAAKKKRSKEGANNVLVMKVFRNGNTQVNGVKTTKDVSAVCDALLAGLKVAFPSATVALDGSPHIIMITSSFYVGTPLKLHDLAAIISQDGAHVRWDSEHHHGLMYKVPMPTQPNTTVSKKVQGTTVIAFSTGKVLLLGAKSMSAMKSAYMSILTYVADNFADVHMDPTLLKHKKPSGTGKRGRPRKQPLLEGAEVPRRKKAKVVEEMEFDIEKLLDQAMEI